MSDSRPLPEAVRGCWYYLPRPVDVPAVRDGDELQTISFDVDGSFRRYMIKGSRRKICERGDYTFDGNFLILRGRRTHTYRVQRPTYWHWKLDGKKKNFALLRGLKNGDPSQQLSDKDCRDIRLLPLRARIEADFENDDVIYRVVFDAQTGPRRLLATFFVEHLDSPSPWIGLTPLSEGIDAPTWERIIRESFLDMYLDGPDEVEEITLYFQDCQKTRQLSYNSARA